MTENPAKQTIIDHEHLRLLSIGYVIAGCMSAFFSILGCIYAFVGLMILSLAASGSAHPGQGLPPQVVAAFFGFLGLSVFVFTLVLTVLKFVVARRLRQRRSRVLCMLVAGLTCLGIPYGTLLGIFTFIVLTRPSVIQQFQAPPPLSGRPPEVADGG